MSGLMALQTLGGDGPRVSRIGLGCMGLSGTWNPAEVGPEARRRARSAFEAALDAGITLFDHADIYGGGSSEEVFKECLRAVPGSRERIIIATKGGIGNGHFNLTAAYLTACLERSLTRMGIDYVDLYQVHRPDPLAHPADTASALNDLIRRGLIRAVGVSNYYPEQTRALQRYLDVPIKSNQIEISLARLDPIYEGLDGGDGVLDQCMALGITPLAWGPLGQGVLHGDRPHAAGEVRGTALRTSLASIAASYHTTPLQVALAWLLAHPARIVPLVGSTNPDHIREAAGAVALSLSREHWYVLWQSAWGREIP